ncbi:class I SAM-dependent methyltransferase [Thalassotalea sp. 1_MG-2023]|uniref:class I SAM-dependent methyltransferase n=1 Tax=Thalassotalea sp. 1_MG-2023 TaxID=3062680 RepID=UPI0026E11B8E|nr:class I SAM-dependent methyltransferase [Thalassotalea sp. 1_MG-2023]MDO6427941.1 class I SAM-dependent methyltransferase [Thalassotalea sp. 1_MG-2023]
MDYLSINRKAWDERTKIHINSRFYDVDAFIGGKSSLNKIELNQVGDVKGKTLLHLQCHFGLDTLSWARKGASVTGVDLSVEAIAQANKLKNKLGLTATFIAADLYQFSDDNAKQYDIVYTSYGALCWLPDIDRWAQTVAKALLPGGELHLIEFHPAIDLLTGYSYFSSVDPDVEVEETYTENSDGAKSTIVTWPHSLADVITALISVGLYIEQVNEFPYSPYNCLEDLDYVAEHGYQLLHKGQQVPLIYAIKARKLI